MIIECEWLYLPLKCESICKLNCTFFLLQERGNVEFVVNGIILQVLKGIRKNNNQATRLSINVNYVRKHLQHSFII